MSKTIDVNLLQKELMKTLTGYKDDISDIVEQDANEIGKEAVAELKQISPRRSKERIL